MAKVYVMSELSNKNLLIIKNAKYIRLRFSGVYCGVSFREILISYDESLNIPKCSTICICGIKISCLEKYKITGKLESIKFLEEFS